jgi:DnaJ domain
MKSCWAILGIPYTTDKQLIKKTYRSLMKQYHPDTVGSPEKKRKYTIRCYEINQAYEDANWEAERGLNRPKTTTASAPPPDDLAATVAQPMGRHPGFWMEYGTHVTYLATMSLLIGAAFFWALPGWDALTDSKPLTVIYRVAGMILCGYVLSSFLVVFVGFASFFLRSIPLILGLDKYVEKTWNKGIWTFMVCASIFVVWLGAVDFNFFLKDPLSAAYNSIFYVVFVGSWPLLFLILWVKDFIKYGKVKDKVAFTLSGIG